MSDLKTQPNDASVEAFLNTVDDAQKRQDCLTLVELMRQATNAEPIMWGSAIVGFGRYRYQSSSGRSGEWFLTGFSPRKQNLTLYILAGFERYDELLARLGKYKTSKSCLYVKRLQDVDLPTLKTLIEQSVEHMITTNA